MTPQQKQLLTCYEKYGFAEVEPVEGGGFAIRIIQAQRGKTPVYGHISYASGSIFKWDSEQEAVVFLAETLGDL